MPLNLMQPQDHCSWRALMLMRVLGGEGIGGGEEEGTS